MGLRFLVMFWGSLRWRHNGGDSVSNHQPRECLLNRLIRCRSKKTSQLRVTGLCVGNSPGTGEFPALMASSTENVSIWWRHHVKHCFINSQFQKSDWHRCLTTPNIRRSFQVSLYENFHYIDNTVVISILLRRHLCIEKDSSSLDKTIL